MSWLCERGAHRWAAWAEPYYHAGTFYQARRCGRCGLVATRGLPDYRPPADAKDLAEFGATLRRVLDQDPLGDVDIIAATAPRVD
ncbi:MAG TPA: hypothetical protein VM366_04155 [Anaerolineae bacterium]|nr:hypothetical protein [Anaerolineae bacterium]